MVSTRAQQRPPGDGSSQKRAFSGDGDAPAPALSRKKRKSEDPVSAAKKRKASVSSTAATLVDAKSKATRAKQVMMTSLSNAEEVSKAIRHLKKCDAKLKKVIEGSQLPKFSSCTSPFLSLAQGIVYQQLASNAAEAIYKRLIHLCGGESSSTPTVILQLPESELRRVGLSGRKVEYLQDLSRKFMEGGLSDTTIMLMEDDELVSTLIDVKGIGMWSIHMFMIFALHRPDVLPVTDLGIRKGFMQLYGLKALPSPEEMEKLAEAWRPYRTVGAWYMWRLLETKAPKVTAKKKR